MNFSRTRRKVTATVDQLIIKARLLIRQNFELNCKQNNVSDLYYYLLRQKFKIIRRL